MTEHAIAERPTSRFGRWLAERRTKIALAIAFAEGLWAAIDRDISRWMIIIIAVPLIVLYLAAGRAAQSETLRQLSWIAAASQALAVLVVILTFAIGLLALILVGVFAAVAAILLFFERPR